LLILVYVSQQIKNKFMRNIDSFISEHTEMGHYEDVRKVTFLLENCA
jgi:hypothetical protein